VVGEDTDMRPHMFDDSSINDINVNNININMIIQEADEQLKNGTISFSHYNTILKQVSMLQFLILYRYSSSIKSLTEKCI
jgi:hypothetical protein